jgi:ketosteroid isomerase-like protein
VSTSSVAQIAEAVRTALDSADLDAFAQLLDPDTTWGAPGDPNPPCRNRRQVLDWYAKGRAKGRRARVVDVTSHNDRILVALKVTGPSSADPAEADRWQLLTIAEGKIRDIRGYDHRSAALVAAGIDEPRP